MHKGVKKMKYFQLFLKDNTPKRIYSHDKLTKKQAAEILNIDNNNIIYFKPIEDKNLHKKPKLVKGEIKWL